MAQMCLDLVIFYIILVMLAIFNFKMLVIVISIMLAIIVLFRMMVFSLYLYADFLTPIISISLFANNEYYTNSNGYDSYKTK